MLRLKPTTLQLTQQDYLEIEELIDNQIRINEQHARLEGASAQTALFSPKESAPNSGMMFGMTSGSDHKGLFLGSAELPQHLQKKFSGSGSNSHSSNARVGDSLQLLHERVQRSGPSATGSFHFENVSATALGPQPQETEQRASSNTDSQLNFTTGRSNPSGRSH
ncbi:hypothetical protein ACO0QE_001568 [Hanseniaspora vineae]